MVCRNLTNLYTKGYFLEDAANKEKNNGYFGQLRWPCNVGVGARAAVHMCVCVLACECARA